MVSFTYTHHTHPFARGRAEDAKSTKYLRYVQTQQKPLFRAVVGDLQLILLPLLHMAKKSFHCERDHAGMQKGLGVGWGQVDHTETVRANNLVSPTIKLADWYKLLPDHCTEAMWLLPYKPLN